MKKVFKNMLLLVGLYAGYMILTLLVFTVTGLYAWNMPPTPLVLTRMLLLPLGLDLATCAVIWLVRFWRRKEN